MLILFLRMRYIYKKRPYPMISRVRSFVFSSSRAEEEADERYRDDRGECRDEYHGGGVVACGALRFGKHGKRDHRRHGGEETERDDHVFGEVPPTQELTEEDREQAHLADDTAVEFDALYR